MAGRGPPRLPERKRKKGLFQYPANMQRGDVCACDPALPTQGGGLWTQITGSRQRRPGPEHWRTHRPPHHRTEEVLYAPGPQTPASRSRWATRKREHMFGINSGTFGLVVVCRVEVRAVFVLLPEEVREHRIWKEKLHPGIREVLHASGLQTPDCLTDCLYCAKNSYVKIKMNVKIR